MVFFIDFSCYHDVTALHLSIKQQSFSPIFFVEDTVFKDQVAVHKSMRHSTLCVKTIVWCPTAFGVFTRIANLLGRVEVNERQIGVIAFADIATTINAVQDSGVVTHQCYQQR